MAATKEAKSRLGKRVTLIAFLPDFEEALRTNQTTHSQEKLQTVSERQYIHISKELLRFIKKKLQLKKKIHFFKNFMTGFFQTCLWLIKIS